MINFDLDNSAFMQLLDSFCDEKNYKQTTRTFMICAIKKKNYKNKQLRAFTDWLLKLDVKNSYFEYQKAESTAAEKYRTFVVNLSSFAKTCKSQQSVSIFLKDQIMPEAIKQRVSEFSKIAWYFRNWKEEEIIDCLIRVNKKQLLKAIAAKASDPVTYNEESSKKSNSDVTESDVTESDVTESSVSVTVKKETESESDKESRLIGEAINTLEEACMIFIDSDELEEINNRLKTIIDNNIKIINSRSKKKEEAA